MNILKKISLLITIGFLSLSINAYGMGSAPNTESKQIQVKKYVFIKKTKTVKHHQAHRKFKRHFSHHHK